MGILLPLVLIIFSWESSALTRLNAQGVKSARLLDLLIRDYTFKSFDKNFRTGMLHSVKLPANLSGIKVDSVRFRCGSLKRYGAQIKEFNLGMGVTLHPCVERVMLVRVNLGQSWLSIYYANYSLSRYRLVSPIVGLFAYNAGRDVNVSNAFELGIHAREKPIRIDFTNSTESTNAEGMVPMCASFEDGGKMMLANQAAPHVCVATRQGHFGLVIESPPEQLRKGISQWKVAVGSTMGAAIGAFLLGLLLVAMFVRVKKKSRMEELERRAYEEEALQVSMVGHVRAPTAAGTRTYPFVEHGSIFKSSSKFNLEGNLSN